MLDGLLGRGFSAKCKSLIKLTKSRIDVIRRKRNATQKFLKKDIADLLASGLDVNAYGRADGLLVELNVSFCYDFVEESCNFILKHLSVMQKIRECPEDCKEAVSSLMFAAARFSDLPELRDLRQIFYERYGNSLEYSTNQELVEKSSSNPPSMEKKVRLMQDIASEFSIRWDSIAFIQRMSKPSPSSQDKSSKHGSNVPTDKYKSINGKNTIRSEQNDHSIKAVLPCSIDGQILPNGKERDVSRRNELILQPRHDIPSDVCKPLSWKEEKTTKMDSHNIPFQGRQEPIYDDSNFGYEKEEMTLKTARASSFPNGKRVEYGSDKHKFRDEKDEMTLKTSRANSFPNGKRVEYGDDTLKPRTRGEDDVPKREIKDNTAYGNPYDAPSYKGQHLKSYGKDPLNSDGYFGEHNTAKPTGKIQEETPRVKPHYNSILPPPYVKPNKPKDNKNGSHFNGVPRDPSLLVRANNYDDRSERNLAESNHHREHERNVDGTRFANGRDDEKHLYYKDTAAGNIPLPKPRSVRRRRHRSSSGQDDVDHARDAGIPKRKSRSRRKDEARRGLQTLLDDELHQNNEDERIIDKLLIHYSKKPSAFEDEIVRRKSKSRHRKGSDGDEVHRVALGQDASDNVTDINPSPVRSISLPHEQTTSSKPKKVYARAATMEPERSNAAAHVHPKLPDYDDLAARFAALKGR